MMTSSVKRKQPRTLIAGLMVLVAWFVLIFYFVKAMLGYPASSMIVSPSGRYIFENVHVGRVLTLGGMAYLRVTDRESPEKVYRTPLYSTQLLDMRSVEDDKTVGIAWMYFNKKERTFDIAMPKWEWHWLNIFISNTPYVHMED
ncbi:hypothetical protein [Pseudomonas sp. FW306-02-H05-AB]|uniref:hypothetical protein n=1 Tax=Pseudomonas sp. FW306-02-H05-AB TaxID=2070666 RepID=UPI000C887BB6|nr:hypothetical protein [Pseudomonas sp. FW306-02-H05-AB]PMZ80148.1 hypothetical protein C1X94_23690 [Pseudomonas sp. FW306-02-H05-AB]